MNLYLTGGAVRDYFMGIMPAAPVKQDYDFAVEAPSFDAMKDGLVADFGFTSYLDRPEFVTTRGRIILPEDSAQRFLGIIPMFVTVDADFTLCRKETQYSDQRHPDTVTPTNIREDLSRRDFTMNAIAVMQNGVVIDPYGGQRDIQNSYLRTVGAPSRRFEEDPLRMLRALRFAVTRAMTSIDPALAACLRDYDMVDKLKTLPHERVREELNRMLRADWRRTMLYLIHEFPAIGDVIARRHHTLWLKATSEER